MAGALSYKVVISILEITTKKEQAGLARQLVLLRFKKL